MSVYYNEIEPNAVAWLRELMKAGLIPDGEVDTRSIVDVQPADLAEFRQCHFFAGIGGWAYALRLAGWPDDRDIWTGSCPCQPWSVAGKGEGADDPRHLWPAWFPLIRERRPNTVFGEQVEGADGRTWLDIVLSEMEGIDYAIGPVSIPACGIGSPDCRPRIWFVADTGRARLQERTALSAGARTPETPPAWREFERIHGTNDWARWDAKSSIRVFAHGLPAVGGRLRGYGNSIKPQVAAEVIAAYMDVRGLTLSTNK